MSEARMQATGLLSVTVIDVSVLPGNSRLIATATMEICIDGVELKLAGVRLVRNGDRGVSVEPPMTRDSLGRPTPCVVLPASILDAIRTALSHEIDGDLGPRIR